MCGGTSRRPGPTASRPGLSPRVRGNRRRPPARPGRPRSIPACAGEPGSRGGGAGLSWVYPRVCGGTVLPSELLCAHQGLSPRVRGNLVSFDAADAVGGSIPACAGEPHRTLPALVGAPVYPRVCGGTLRLSGIAATGAGLSPRVRGNHWLVCSGGWNVGSIPACAGEPRPAPGCRTTSEVYPRVCGGTMPATPHYTTSRGLSPRVRGNLTVEGSCSIWVGSIPACAGEPIPTSATWRTTGVYPRVCGGTPPTIVPPPYTTGLSPRVRGNLRRAVAGQPQPRSIPACAGEPDVSIPVRRFPRVYPRVCGGTPARGRLWPSGCGLSPRVRGNPGAIGENASECGSIPACAGEPGR